MQAILGAVSLAAGLLLLRYAMIANRQAVKPGWTTNWLTAGLMAPAVISLFAIGIILAVRFGLEFQSSTTALIEVAAALLIFAGGIVLWRRWDLPSGAAQASPFPLRPIRTSGTSRSGSPRTGAPAGAGRGGRKAA